MMGSVRLFPLSSLLYDLLCIRLVRLRSLQRCDGFLSIEDRSAGAVLVREKTSAQLGKSTFHHLYAKKKKK